MEYTAVFEEQVALTPRDLRKKIVSIDSVLEQKLKTRLEGRCSRHGYVKPDGIRILSRSMGLIERGRFTGSLLFHVQAEGDVINPPDGTILEGKVIRKNKMGLYVEYAKAIRIIIPRDMNIGNEEYESVDIDETVEVEIKKSRFQVNDEYILSVGLFRKRRSAGEVEREEEEETSEEVPEEAPEEEEELEELADEDEDEEEVVPANNVVAEAEEEEDEEEEDEEEEEEEEEE